MAAMGEATKCSRSCRSSARSWPGARSGRPGIEILARIAIEPDPCVPFRSASALECADRRRQAYRRKGLVRANPRTVWWSVAADALVVNGAQHASRVGRSPAPARLALTHFGGKAAAFVATQINHGPSSPCCLQNEMVDANGTETRSVPCALINPALHRFRPASPW